VKTHLVHVFAKLGVSSRSQLAAEAIKRGIGGRGRGPGRDRSAGGGDDR
jgi:hypothetical protein